MNGGRLPTSKHASHFFFAFWALPREKRQALFAVYAFSRAIDDAVDGSGSPTEKADRLEFWKGCLEEAYREGEGHPLDPVITDLAWAVRRFQIPKEYLQGLVTGVEMDLHRTRYGTFVELEKYCYHVAGTVGLICNAIFGERTPRAERYAVTLGTAFQLTNIIRDTRRDLARGRIYLPQEELKRFGVSEAMLSDCHPVPARRALMIFQADRARDYFRQALSLLDAQTRHRFIAAQIMTAIYYRILTEIERNDFALGDEPFRLPVATRLRITLGVWLEARSGGRIPSRFLGVYWP